METKMDGQYENVPSDIIDGGGDDEKFTCESRHLDESSISDTMKYMPRNICVWSIALRRLVFP